MKEEEQMRNLFSDGSPLSYLGDWVNRSQGLVQPKRLKHPSVEKFGGKAKISSAPDLKKFRTSCFFPFWGFRTFPIILLKSVSLMTDVINHT